MRIQFRQLAVAATASALLLSACGSPEPDETTSSPSAVQESETTLASATPTPDEEAATSEAASPSPAGSVEESPVAQPTSTRTPVATGPLEGEELNADGIAWFDAFCAGVTDAQSYANTSSEEQELDEVVELAGTTYRKMGTSVTATSDKLRGLKSDMNFENSDAFAAEVSDIFEEVGQVYWAGADNMESSTFSSEQEFTAAIEDVSSSIIDAGGFDFGIPTLDATVSTAVAEQAPACASL